MQGPITGDQTARNAQLVIAVIAAGAALYWLRGILAPFSLAVFLVIMIDGVGRAIRRRLPAVPALPVAVGLVIVLFAVSVLIIADGFANFRHELGGLHARVDQIIADVGRLLHLGPTPTLDQLMGGLDPAKYLLPAASVAQELFGAAFFVLIYAAFLLASQQSFRKKLVALFPTHDARQEAQNIFSRIRDGVEGYLWVQTVTSLMIVAAAWIVMRAVGLQNAEFWAFVILLSGYIPIIGGAVAGVAPPLFALVQFQTYWQAAVLFVALQAILFLVGNIILPRMQSRSMNIDTVVVLLSLAFWGALWGVIGAFLSTPLTVMAMAILAEFRSSRWIAVLLSGDGEPYPVEPPETPLPGGPDKSPQRKPPVDKGSRRRRPA